MITEQYLITDGWVRCSGLPHLWGKPGFMYFQPDNNLMAVRGLGFPDDRSELAALVTKETESP